MVFLIFYRFVSILYSTYPNQIQQLILENVLWNLLFLWLKFYFLLSFFLSVPAAVSVEGRYSYFQKSSNKTHKCAQRQLAHMDNCGQENRYWKVIEN